MAKSTKAKKIEAFDYWGYFLLLVIIAITIFSQPNWKEKVSIHHVWYYGWITAISTGLGSIPFYFFPEPDKFWMGVSNAVAGGMMIAASYSLAHEGATFSESDGVAGFDPYYTTAVGFASGIAFILLTKYILDRFQDLKIGEIEGASAQKVVLIVFVMTLHSLSEGIGIGVSFGGKSGLQLGQFISLSLAVHNIPEGLAVALVMTSRKVSILRAGLWAVFTSLPQPIMAIPAYMFVENFIHLLPAGLGFASGAMAYVAVFELLTEAIEATGVLTGGVIGCLACASMVVIQDMVKESI